MNREAEININTMSLNQVTAKMKKMAKDNPEIVINAFGDDAKRIIFVLKLEQYGIITKKEESYYEGSRFIAASINEVAHYLTKKDNEAVLDRFKRLLNQKEDNTPESKSMITYDEIIKTIESAMFRKDFINADTSIKKGLRSYPEDKTLMDLQKLCKEAIMDNADTEKAKRFDDLKSELSEMTLEDLIKKCVSWRSKGIKKEDYQDKTREEIIEFLISKA